MLIRYMASFMYPLACAADVQGVGMVGSKMMEVLKRTFIHMTRTDTLDESFGSYLAMHSNDMLKQFIWPNAVDVTNGTMPPLYIIINKLLESSNYPLFHTFLLPTCITMGMVFTFILFRWSHNIYCPLYAPPSESPYTRYNGRC